MDRWILTGLALLSCRASFYLLKRICLLLLLWVVAYIDLKEYRIPNRAIIAGLGCKVFIVGLEIILGQFALELLILEFLAAIILVVSAVICRLIIKNSIGAGDIKLLVVMALFLGWYEIWRAVFLSSIAFLGIAVFLILTQKKEKIDYIPFGPAFAIGTSASFLLTM